jgi:hypothetical protein
VASERTAEGYFSDYFGVKRNTLARYGAFDISLVTDLPLFIDPFLLFNESHAFQEYVIAHELLHLKLRNHGRVFRSLLTTYLPGWRRFCPNGLGTSCTSGPNDRG